MGQCRSLELVLFSSVTNNQLAELIIDTIQVIVQIFSSVDWFKKLRETNVTDLVILYFLQGKKLKDISDSLEINSNNLEVNSNKEIHKLEMYRSRTIG